MSDVDTSAEAVDGLRALLHGLIDRIVKRDDVAVLRIPPDPKHDADMICAAAEKTLRALLAERDALQEQIRALKANKSALEIGVDEAQAERDAAQAQAKRLWEALEKIAKQKKTTELVTAHDVEFADFEGGYDECIDTARAALAKEVPDA